MREKINNSLIYAWDEFTYCIRQICGKPTPLKRFVIVLVISGILSIAYICTLISSIYNIGKRDGEKEFIELQHIKPLDMQNRNDSINNLKQKNYEYE